MWNNIDIFEKENGNECLDITSFMSLLHVTGYCGDLDGQNETEPLAWKGGAPVAEGSPLTAQKENAMLKRIGGFWKENRRDLIGCAMFTCFMAVVSAARVLAYV